MNERTGIVEMKGKPLTLIGSEIKVGDMAPDFEAMDNSLQPIKLSSFKGKVVVVSTVPSLDTQICDIETKQFSEQARKLGDDVVFLTMSMDLPFAQKRWSEEAGVKNIHLLSDHRDGKFGMSYGVLIKGLRLLARTIFVIDVDGKVQYIQYVKETGSEPDYDEVLESVGKLI
ncbi:MAG: thiol peroxidase [candidate division Zixibacteria bacterium]|nr:thiol peroxidase [candidate division Zixibacteria bacterium]